MIIDGHTCWHTYEMKGIRYDAGEFVATLVGCGIDRAMVCNPFALLSDQVFGNDRTLKLMSAYPDFVVGYATLHPLFGQETLDELARCHDAGMRGVKLHCDLATSPYDHPAHDALMARAAEYAMPVHMHTGADSIERAKGLAERVPEATYIFAHCGGEAWRETAEWAAGRPNVNLCVSGLVFDLDFLEGMVEILGEDRIIFGSDFVYVDPNIFLGVIARSRLSEAAKDKILGLNLKRLLGL